MSTTIQGIDARGYVIGWLKGLVGMYSADINAIPDDKWTATFGGCTRPANELTADAISLVLWTTEAINGNVISEGGESTIKNLAAELTSKSVAIAKLSESVDALVGALGSASDETLNATVTTPWQMPTPLFMIAQITASHLWYHDGQLNYIQCLLGDEKIHWMG